MQKNKAIIFDIDDTLVQTIQCKWSALKKTALKCYNRDISDEQIKAYLGKPFKEMIEGVFSYADSFDKIKQYYFDVSKGFPMKAHVGALDTIHNLKEKYLIGALTASSRLVILNDLKDAGFNLNDFFFIQTSEDTIFHKPAPQVFNPLLKKLQLINIKKENILFIGDGILDYEATKKAAIPFIAITTGLNTLDDFKINGVRTKCIINKLSNLQSMLL